MDMLIRPQHMGRRIGLELSKRQIVLKNDSGSTKEIAPLIYVIWRKCNSENTVIDLIDYCVDRTHKSKEFISGIVCNILESLRTDGFLQF